MTRARSIWLGIATFFLVLLICFCAVGFYLERWRAPTYERWRQIAVGDTEAKVRASLGTPRYEYDAASAPADYYIEGYGKPDRGITGRVLIYLERDLVLYVWIDADGRVEEMMRGVS